MSKIVYIQGTHAIRISEIAAIKFTTTFGSGDTQTGRLIVSLKSSSFMDIPYYGMPGPAEVKKDFDRISELMEETPSGL